MQYIANITISDGSTESYELTDLSRRKPIPIQELSEVQFEINRKDGQAIEENIALYIGSEEIALHHSDFEKKALKSDASNLFLHSLGLVQISLSVNSAVIQLQNISVRTQKISKAAIRYMYSYLSDSNSSTLTNRARSHSVYDAQSAQGDEDIASTLNLAKSLINTCKDLFYNNSKSVQKQLHKTNEISPYKAGTPISANGITWLIKNLDVAVSSSPDEASFSHLGKNFKPRYIYTEKNSSTNNTKENSTILAVLYTVLFKLTSLSKASRTTPNKEEDLYTYGELLFLHQSEIAHLATEYSRLINHIEKTYKVTPSQIINLKYTDKFKSTPIYRKIYKDINKWNNFQGYDHNNFEFYKAVVPSTTIFELYCLIRIKRSLESSGWKPTQKTTDELNLESVSIQENTLDNSKFLFESDTKTEHLCLYYEPKILKKIKRKAKKNIYYTKKSSSASYCHPDFLLIHYSLGRIKSIGIIDAKFSTKSMIENKSLPELVNQYYVNIVSDESQTPLSYIYAIYPSSKSTSVESFAFRSTGYNLLEENQLQTSMGAIGIDFLNSDESNLPELLESLINS